MHSRVPINEKKSKRRDFGFTLIELWTVITIIAIVAGLLLPVLAKAKAKAQGILCMNHLRQLGMAWMMYADDHGERIPPNSSVGGPDDYDPDRVWVRGSLHLERPRQDNTNQFYLATGQLTTYGGSNLEVYKCPGDRSTSRHGGRLYPRVRTLAMNSYLANPRNLDSPFQDPFKITEFVALPPTRTFVLIDEREDSINNAAFVFPGGWIDPLNPGQLGWRNWPASYHHGAAALNFADGHSEIHRWLDPRTMPPIGRIDIPLENHAQPGNPDCIWLYQRTTKRK